jgi:hypothetical protein
MTKTLKLIMSTLIFFGTLIDLTSAKDIEFGDTVKPVTVKDCRDETITIPAAGKVSVLIFFSSQEEMHSKFLAEQEPLFAELVDGDNRVHIFFVTIGNAPLLSSLVEKYRRRFSFIDDTQKKVFSSFQYSCGTCLKVVILDGEGVVRYSSFKFAPYFIKSIAKRYESCGDKK